MSARAYQAGNGTYAAATPVDHSFLVTKVSQTITFAAIANKPIVPSPITLAPPERYLVAVGALCEGRCATFDTATSELVPHQL